MTTGIAQVHVKKHKGQMIVIGYGQTSRGQKYVKDSVALHVPRPQDSGFKGSLDTAIKTLLS